MKFYFLVGFFLMYLGSFAQNTSYEADRFDELEKTVPEIGDEGANLKFHKLLELSKKLNLHSRERHYVANIMLDHYDKRRKDSCLYYLQKLKVLVKQPKDVLSTQDKMDVYIDIADMESFFYGYNFSVTTYFSEAYKLALASGDHDSIFYILFHITDLVLLREEDNLVEVDQVIGNIKNALEKYPDNNYKLGAYSALTDLYLLKDDLETAKGWIDKMMTAELVDEYDKYQRFMADGLMSDYYFKKGEVYKALDILNAAMQKDGARYENEEGFSIVYYSYFLYYSYVGKHDKALSFITKVNDASLSIYEEIYFKDKMLQYLYEQGKHTLAKKVNQEKLQLLSEISVADDSVLSKFFLNELQKKDLEVVQKSLVHDNLILKRENAEKKALLAVVLIVFIILFFAVIFYVIRKKGKKKDKTIISLREREAKVLKDLVAQRENELQLIAVKVANRMMTLQELKETVAGIQMMTPEINTLKTKINRLITSGSELTEVSDRLQTQYPGIYFNLKQLHPELSETEIKYCLLTKLNLSLKETANILMVSPDTVKHTRSRVKRKMEIPKEITLKEYMDKISNKEKGVA